MINFSLLNCDEFRDFLGKKMRLSEDAEECATFYGKMLDHDYTTKEVFNKNFFKDWRKSMTDKEKEKIRDLSKCNFSEINTYFKKVIFFLQS